MSTPTRLQSWTPLLNYCKESRLGKWQIKPNPRYQVSNSESRTPGITSKVAHPRDCSTNSNKLGMALSEPRLGFTQTEIWEVHSTFDLFHNYKAKIGEKRSGVEKSALWILSHNRLSYQTDQRWVHDPFRIASSSKCSWFISLNYCMKYDLQQGFFRLIEVRKHPKKFPSYKRYKNLRIFLDEKAKC
jgi:hypothetical protein